jgi:MFS transporter, putative metabolite:H+ symporter
MRGTGACSTAGRLTSAFIQFGIVALFTWSGVNGVIGTVAAVLLFQAVVIAVFGIETKQRTLEEISALPATRWGAPPELVPLPSVVASWLR